ncbi:MAG: radical SAM protein [Lachnospiraceae bacterium]|nr:radical SAM protein [Lachnospiraceae bacterium]
MNEFDLENYLFAKGKQKGVPVRAVLELTPVCNFRCGFCYIRHSHKECMELGGEKPVEFWKMLIPQMKEMGILIVTLIGGEPFLYQGFGELYSELLDNGFLVNITSNGSMITDELIELLKEKPPRYVTVSLYGASDETYHRVTGNPKGFSMTIAGIERLLEAGIAVKLNYVTVPGNQEDFDAIYELSNRYHLPLLADAYCFTARRRSSEEGFQRLSPEQAARYHMEAKKRDPKVDYPGMCRRIASGEVVRVEEMHYSRISCYAGSALFWISWKGDMMPCGFLEQLRVPLEENQLSPAWEKLKERVAAVRTADRCSSCKHREICYVCPASMVSETGSFHEAPEYLCQMTEEIVRIAERENDGNP